MSISSSQGSVETSFRWGGKRLHYCERIKQETVYQISSELPEFCIRYYKKKHFDLFLSTCERSYTVLSWCADAWFVNDRCFAAECINVSF